MAKELQRINLYITVIPAGQKDGISGEILKEDKIIAKCEELFVMEDDGEIVNRVCGKCPVEIDANVIALAKNALKCCKEKHK